MTGSALLAFFPSDSTTVSMAVPSVPGNVFYGLITIAQNGTVVYTGNGDISLLTVNGNNYNLTGAVYGEISIQHNGTVFNGLGYCVNALSQPTLNMLNITNATNVVVENLSLSAADESGIFIENSTHVLVSDVNVSAYKYAAQILNNTEYINVSNSILSFNALSSDNISTVSDGVYMSNGYSMTYLSSSLNNYFFNDTIYSSYTGLAPSALFSNATHTVFDDLHFIGPAFTGALLTANNESLIHSTFTGSFIRGVFLKSLGFTINTVESPLSTYASGQTISAYSELQNVSIVDNTFNLYRTPGAPVSGLMAINTFSEANISGNDININNAGGTAYTSALGILAEGSNLGAEFVTNGSIIANQKTDINIASYTPSETGLVFVNDNSISIENSSSSSSGISADGSIVNISHNNLHFSNASAEAIILDFSTFSNLSDNTVTVDNSSTAGIYVQRGSNETISHNTILNTNTTVGGNGVSLYQTQNETILDNSISGFGFDFAANLTGNVTFTGNNLGKTNTSIEINATHNVEFYHNNFSGYSYAAANITNSTSILLNASYPVGGNFWSGYTGTASADGFGSTPYTVAPGYEDYLPLTQKWTYPVAVFTETGLPAGAQWGVLFNGQMMQTSLDTMTFTIQNGAYISYNYTVYAPSGFYSSVGNGSSNYTGSSVSTSLVFTHYSYLNGTILPSNATVTLNGVVMNNLAGGNFNISLKSGSYELIVNETGYNTYYLNFTVLPGQTEHVNISLNKTSSNTTAYYLIGAGAIVMVALTIGSIWYRRKGGS